MYILPFKLHKVSRFVIKFVISNGCRNDLNCGTVLEMSETGGAGVYCISSPSFVRVNHVFRVKDTTLQIHEQGPKSNQNLQKFILQNTEK